MAKIFTPEFNQFESINATQAWSLFFSISSTDEILGQKRSVGRYITLGLVSALIAGVLQAGLGTL